MSKPRSAFVDFSVYLMVRLLVCILQALPFHMGCKFAALLAKLAYKVDRRHREVALDNLRQAFPGRYTEPELDEMVRAVFLHFCRMVVEIIHIPRKVHLTNWRKYIKFQNPIAFGTLISGRPVIVVSAHFGNWELGGYLSGLLGFQFSTIARPIDNPYLDRFLRGFREKTRQRILTKKGEFAQIEGILANGGLLTTLCDQDAGPRGQFVDFFGRPASTHKAIALLALKHRAMILILCAVRVAEPMFYHVLVGDLIDAADYQDRAVSAITQRFTTSLERMVRAYPDQYFWLHRRWKHQPANAKRKAAA
jgi:KDO2-lipid IV(A) lauroyltransferase